MMIDLFVRQQGKLWQRKLKELEKSSASRL